MRSSFLIMVFIAMIISWGMYRYYDPTVNTGAPPYGESEDEANQYWLDGELLNNWVRPDGPARVGIQMGHFNHEQAPDELINLRKNGGAQGRGMNEAEVNLEIAVKVKQILEEKGITVTLLSTTIPPQFWADVFVTIHADGNSDKNVSGYKVAGPWRDMTGNSDSLVQAIETAYGTATQLPKDPMITKNMRGYYAFSWWRYEHTIHPMTTAAIVETGFLTNPRDQRIIVDQPEVAAQGIADGIIDYLHEQELIF